MATAKKRALEMINNLPEKSSWEDILYEIYVTKKIAGSLKAADEGRIISHSDVRKRFF